MTLEWKPAFSTGDAQLDVRHQELFRRADRLLGAAADSGDVVPLLGALHAHAAETFAIEEARMLDERYPGFVRHKAEHDRFLEDLLQIAEDHGRHGPDAFGAGASRWLSRWLAEHGAGTDAALARAFARRKSA
jgi:hemerythrin